MILGSVHNVGEFAEMGRSGPGSTFSLVLSGPAASNPLEVDPEKFM